MTIHYRGAYSVATGFDSRDRFYTCGTEQEKKTDLQSIKLRARERCAPEFAGIYRAVQSRQLAYIYGSLHCTEAISPNMFTS